VKVEINEDKISIIVPVYNEQEVLEEFNKRLISVISNINHNFEVIYVDDGSKDKTNEIIDNFQRSENIIVYLKLSRNFGKEIAMTAGIDYAKGDAAIIIDSDLQDPPELIPELIKKWEQGYDVVYARRKKRIGETYLKKITASIFYLFMSKVGKINMPRDTGDFRLLGKQALESVRQFREQHRFMKGLFCLIGFRQKEVLYDRDPRFSGKTKWNYLKLWDFAIEGITSFTIMPLKIAMYFGFLVAMGSLLYGAFIVFRTLIFGNPVPGYPSIIVIILFLGGVQLITTGILGEYLGRTFNETKKRPLYFISEVRKNNK